MKNRQSVLYTLRFTVCTVIIAAVILLIGFMFKSAIDKKSNTSPAVSTKNDKTVIVIDAGHGGEDAGAIAADGTLEKELNLQIASLVKVLCDLNGTSAVMTREDDTLLYDYYGDLENYTGQKKLYDLKNRVRITNEYENAVFLGIHMNKFSTSQCSGLQIYYSKNNPASELLARSIQNSARTYLQPENNRAVKAADSSIYVLYSLHCPAVLVECGFLSNESELELLKTEEYQAKLSLVLFTSALSQTE